MSRWAIWTVGATIVCFVLVALGSELLSRSACRAATKDGTIRNFHQFTGEALERDVRSRVPLGSSRELVERFLTMEGIRFSYDPSLNATLANAPCLKGSGIIVKSLGLTFRFNEDAKVTSIESHIHLTGP